MKDKGLLGQINIKKEQKQLDSTQLFYIYITYSQHI